MCWCSGAQSGGSSAATTANGAAGGPEFLRVARELAQQSPWADVHAHPGRCFLRGLDPADPLVAFLGADVVDDAIADLGESRVAVTSFATVSDLRVLSIDPSGGIRAGRSFAAGEAYADHRRQIHALGAIADGQRLRLLSAASDIDEVHRAGGVGMLLTCEGGDFLEGHIERVEEAHRAGVRSITLVHYRVNELGDIQTESPVHGGLTAFGGAVVAEMNRLGMVVDLAHATFEVTKAVLDRSSQPVMISHSHLARGTPPHPRLLHPEHALAVSRAGGLIGAWPAGVALGSFDDFVGEILRLIDVVGVDHVGIGTDMDANFRPVVDSYRQYAAIAAGLLARGLDHGEVGQVMGGNFVRLLRAVVG